MFNKPASEAGLLNKSLRLAPALGVTKVIIDIGMILVTLFVLLKSEFHVQQTHLWPLNSVCSILVRT